MLKNVKEEAEFLVDIMKPLIESKYFTEVNASRVFDIIHISYKQVREQYVSYINIPAKLSKNNFSWMRQRARYSYLDLLTIKNEKPDVLDKTEQNYLGTIVHPLIRDGNYIISITKSESSDTKYYDYVHLIIKYEDNIKNIRKIFLPPFKRGMMYNGMELYREYTLEELKL